MKKPKLTDWFEPDVKPKLKGVYQRNYKDESSYVSTAYANFDGKFWFRLGYTPQGALDRGNAPSRAQELPWRGLAEDPNKEQA